MDPGIAAEFAFMWADLLLYPPQITLELASGQYAACYFVPEADEVYQLTYWPSQEQVNTLTMFSNGEGDHNECTNWFACHPDPNTVGEAP